VSFHKSFETPRNRSLFKGLFSIVFSPDFFCLIKALMIDVLFQGRILKTSVVRWVMHILIFTGFMALVFMHGMDTLITERIFSSYYSTINPFFFLRSLFGLAVLVGIGIAICRRYFLKPARLKNAVTDFFAIMIVSVIILSGIALEGMKMTSVSEFTVMVEDYAGLDYEDEDVAALETYWVKEFALVSPRIFSPFESEVIDLGIEIHESNCMDCHSPNKSAFLGYTAAKFLSPVALTLDKINGVKILYYLHILSCFFALALVPFSKMFHMVATPISLLTNAVTKQEGQTSDYQLTKQLMELDACTHCGTCNLNCSASTIYTIIQNDAILPSEKMQILKKAACREKLTSEEFTALYQGMYLCTNCDRCTVVCPSGIHLKSLWLSVREDLIQQDLIKKDQQSPFLLTGFSFVPELNKLPAIKEKNPAAEILKKVIQVQEKTDPLNIYAPVKGLGLDLTKTEPFFHCFGCQNCSTICPVVADFKYPEKTLTLLPHQIMYSLGLGLVDMAKGSAMIWNCLSCYQCQENCPQNVNVCDILFKLKNTAFTLHQDTRP
jgi:heterodisulfide reductase subunit C/nitrate reductase gamma subunit